ncbi:MAG: VWA domain-containing protein [Chloroflexi bacterium]|nr:VWA domain-containing protein [Chloroflexota bacterium]
MTLDRIWLLAFLALIPLAIWMTHASRARLSRRRTAVAAILRSVAIAAMVVALAGPGGGSGPPVTIFAVDTSASVPLADQALAMGQVEDFARAFSSDTPVGVVQFAGRAAVLASPDRLEEAPPLTAAVPTDATDLAQGLSAALALVPPDREGRIVLVSDGNPTAGNLDAAINAAVVRGVTVSPMPVASEAGTDLAIDGLDVPPAVRRGAAAQAQITVVSGRLTSARLRLWSAGTLLSDAQVELRPGRQTFIADLTGLPDGFHRLRAELLEDADVRRANNVAEAATWVQPAGSILLVGDAVAPAVQGALAASGLDITAVRPADLESTALREFDAVVMTDTAADSLSRIQMESLREYVRDGYGLVVAGGAQSYAAGGYEGTPLDEVLPVWSNPTEARPDPRLAIVLLIDRSSSMSRETPDDKVKIDLAIQGAVEAVEVLDEGDIIGVIAFDENTQWVVPPRAMESVTDLSSVVDAIQRIQIGNLTDMFLAMYTARERLQRVDASVKHVILLTDGKAHRGDFEAMTRSMRRRDITISSIAIGEDADKDLLTEVARLGNGRYYFAPTASDLPRVLTQETRLAGEFAIVEREFQPRLQTPSPVFAGELQGQALPNLTGYVRTRAKPTAEVVLASDSNDPILAQWQFGRGRAVAWTSDLGGDWAEDWSQWPMFAAYLRQAVDWVMPPPDGTLAEGLYPVVEATAERTTITIDSLESDGSFRNGLDTSVRLISPGGETLAHTAHQSAPGRYTLDTASPPPGVYEVQIEQRTAGALVASSQTSLVVPARAEFRSIEPDLATLRRIAAATGGAMVETPTDLARTALRATPGGQHLGWPLFLTIGLLCAVADIGVRRVRGTPREVWEQLRERVESLRTALRSLRRLRRFRQRP